MTNGIFKITYQQLKTIIHLEKIKPSKALRNRFVTSRLECWAVCCFTDVFKVLWAVSNMQSCRVIKCQSRT